MVVSPSGRVTVCSPLQYKKHWSLIVVTDEGMLTDTSALSFLKQPAGSVVRPCGIAMLLRLVQLQKA